ncbi:ABC-2 type transport system ATP-binding protein [Thermohydrogenium kirishiense]|nr:ABC-2 type transport system ATP-binding protein [Thermohydrogenium kirishiense]
MKAAIQIKSLTKKFGDITAVDNLNLQINEGEIFGLVGPDGAGKTTTMRMLCSLLMPDSGTAEVGGYDVITQREELIRQIGYMPQKFSLYGDLTVEENLAFYAEVYQIPPKVYKEKVQYLLEFNNLKEHSYKLADQLSGGMKQKLALSCNLLHTPKYLFLDEPTIGVDPVARREFWKILFDLREQGVTIFVSTSYMDEAERCDKIGLMNRGKVVIVDSPDKIIANFQKDVVRIYSDDNYRLRDFAAKLNYVEDVYIFGEELHLIIENFNELSDKLIKDFKSSHVKIYSFDKILPSIEDVFVNTIKIT